MNRGEDLDRLMRILNAWGAMNYAQLLGGMGAGFGDKLDSIVRAMSSDEIVAFAKALNVNDPGVAQRFQLLLMTTSPDDFRAEVRSPGSTQRAQTPKTGCAILIGLMTAGGVFVPMSLLLIALAFTSGCGNPGTSTSQPKVDRAKLVGLWVGPDPRGGDFKELELQLAEDGTGKMRMKVQNAQIRGTLMKDVSYTIDPASTQVKIEYGKDVGTVELMPDGQLKVTLGQETGLLQRPPGK
jgi:hypothetical protein